MATGTSVSLGRRGDGETGPWTSLAPPLIGGASGLSTGWPGRGPDCSRGLTPPGGACWNWGSSQVFQPSVHGDRKQEPRFGQVLKLISRPDHVPPAPRTQPFRVALIVVFLPYGLTKITEHLLVPVRKEIIRAGPPICVLDHLVGKGTVGCGGGLMDGTVMEAHAEAVSLREEPPSLSWEVREGRLQVVTLCRSLKGGQESA